MPPRKTEDANRAMTAESQIHRSYTYKKTGRSHEENQERAYVAASRRSDRSIEARIQSARQASEIHKKRTGRALHITEEIVRNEEMYEEEDDSFPRSFRMLNPHLQAPAGSESNNVASRAEAYLITRQEMSRMVCQNQAAWINENAVNKAFANAFPNHTAAQRTPSMSTEQTSIYQSAPTPGAYMPSPYMNNMPSPYASADQYSGSTQSTFTNVNYAQPSGHQSRTQSFSAPSPATQQPDTPASGAPTPALTPTLTPTLSSIAEEPSTPAQESFLYGYESGSFTTPFDQASSAFTTTMPNDARMLMGGPMSWDNSNEQSTYGNATGYSSFASTYNSMQPMEGQDDFSAYPDFPASQSQDFGGDDMFSNFIDPEGWEKSFAQNDGNSTDSFFDAHQDFDANQDTSAHN